MKNQGGDRSDRGFYQDRDSRTAAEREKRFLSGLVQNLPRAHYYLFRANPDGEGTWTWRSEETAVFRRKGAFREENVGWYIQVLQKADLVPIVLVDLGGKVSPENEAILHEGGVDYAIILSSDPGEIPEWEGLAQKTNTRVLARIVSDYHAAADDLSINPLRVHYLERGGGRLRTTGHQTCRSVDSEPSGSPDTNQKQGGNGDELHHR